ncbi:MAG: efflux RND transporter permease subunit [Anaerostipes hadrus]
MDHYTSFVVKHKKTIIFLFVIAAAICAFLSTMVEVDYKFADYLPDDAQSTKAIDIMNEEYDQEVPNVRVMIKNVSIAKALDYKEKIEAIDGVQEVNWLDDATNIYQPLEMMDQDTVNDWYKNKNALYQITMDESNGYETAMKIRKVIGNDNYMSGEGITNSLTSRTTANEIQKIVMIVVPIVFIILLLTTNSWFEPVLFMATIGIAIMINRGTNLMFGTISFVTNAAGSILQLAVSMDYGIFLLHRFSENRQAGEEAQTAMINAVKQSVGSVMSSGLTTVTGFAALILMRFKIGPDMGWVMVKAIILSLFAVLCLLPALTLIFYPLIDKTEHRSFLPKFRLLSKVVLDWKPVMIVLFVIFMIPSYFGQQKNSFLYGGSKVYQTNATEIGRDMNAIEKEYGVSNQLVLMVPKGDMEKEIELNQQLKEIDGVTSVVSYINSVGEAIPKDFVPKEQLSKLYSKNYSRYVVTVSTEEGNENWQEITSKVENAGKKYYGDKSLMAGNPASTQDLKTTITQDMTRVNILSIAFVFTILLFNFKSMILPVILTLVIEASIWINLTVPYFAGSDLYYIGYLIISSVQLGATIDYGILFTDRYREYRKQMGKKRAAMKTIQSCTMSILTSASILTVAGIVLGTVSTNGVLSQLGILIGRGAVISFILVIFVLPGLLMIFDKPIEKLTYHADFYKGGKLG